MYIETERTPNPATLIGKSILEKHGESDANRVVLHELRSRDALVHHEHYRIEPAAWEVIRSARRVVAIGTTSVRALESAAVSGELSGRTDLFIRRPYAWQVVDVLMTNFHLPKSSLLVMIDAFIGPRWRDLYELAMDEGYRFLSFGDAMFLERAVSLDPAPLPDRS